jgi:hypothetical protein
MGTIVMRRSRGRPRLPPAQHYYLFPKVFSVRMDAVGALRLEGLRQQRGLSMSKLLRQLVWQVLAQEATGSTRKAEMT